MTQIHDHEVRQCAVHLVEHRPSCPGEFLLTFAGSNRPFVVGNMSDFKEPSGQPASPGRYRFELTYTDGSKSFRYNAAVYSTEFDLVSKLSQR